MRFGRAPQFQVTSAPTIPTDVEHPSLTPWKACAIGLGVVGMLVALAVLDTRAREQEDGTHLFGARRGRKRKRGADLGDMGVVTVTRHGQVKSREGEWIDTQTSHNVPEDEREAWYMHERDVPADRREAFEKGFVVGRKDVEAIPEVRHEVLNYIDEMIHDNPLQVDREAAKIRDIVEKDEGALEELCKDETACGERVRQKLVEDPDDAFIDEVFDRRDSKLTRGRKWYRAFESHDENIEESARSSFYENLDEQDCHYFVEEAKKEAESDCESSTEEAVEKAREEERQAIIDDPGEAVLDAIFVNDEAGDDWRKALDQYVDEHGVTEELTADEKFDKGFKYGQRLLARSIKNFEKQIARKEREINEQADEVRTLRKRLKAKPTLINAELAALSITDAIATGKRALDEGNCTQTQNSLIEAQAGVIIIEQAEAERQYRSQIAAVQGLRADMHRVCALTARFVPNAPPSPRELPRARLFPEVHPDVPAAAPREPEKRFSRLEVDGLGGTRVRVRGHVRSRPRRCKGVCR
jgi:hypothetical protein